MQGFKDSKILIIDNEPTICELLAEMATSWGLTPHITSDESTVLEKLKDGSWDVVLLDIYMPNVSGFDLLPKIVARCPDVKVIMMTGYADKVTAIRALNMGAFDILAKPFSASILFQSLRRALKMRQNERELEMLLHELDCSRRELLEKKKQVELLNDRIARSNNAVSILARNLDLEMDRLEKSIAWKLRSAIVPSLDRLRNVNRLAPCKCDLDFIVNQIENLTSDLVPDPDATPTLSSTELRVASLVKNGISTEEIARNLHISAATVRTHRKNIRRKLNINDAKYSLRNYLRAVPMQSKGRA